MQVLKKIWILRQFWQGFFYRFPFKTVVSEHCFGALFFKVDVLHASIWYWYSSEHLFYNKIILGITFCIHICFEIPKLKSSEKSWKCTTPTLENRLYFKNKRGMTPFFWLNYLLKRIVFHHKKFKKKWIFLQRSNTTLTCQIFWISCQHASAGKV